jgi:uncharacterized protein
MADKKEHLENKLEELTEEYSGTKYNKATNKHLGILRFKIAKAKRDIEEASKRSKGKGYFVKKTGDGTVALVGFPSAGKSSILNVLGNAKSKTAQYAFTTTTLVPAVMLFRDAHIQIFDLPGIIEGAHSGVGGGSTVMAAARSADLIMFVISSESIANLGTLIAELEMFNVHINKDKPNIQIRRDVTFNGLKIEVNRSGMPDQLVEEILKGLGTHNASVQIWSRVGPDEFLTIVSNRSLYLRAIVALNKIDLKKDYEQMASEIAAKYSIEVIPISATQNKNIDQLRGAMYGNLGLMRVYLKPRTPGERATPMTVRKGLTVGEIARILHTQVANDLKSALIDGPSSKFKNQRVGAQHVIQDGDTVTFIT